MKNEPAQSPVNAMHSHVQAASGARAETGKPLSVEEVIGRLFSPDSKLPQPRNDKAIVVVTAGETERAVTHRQVENLIAHGVEELKKRGVQSGDKVIFYCDNCPELTSTILASWSLNVMVVLMDYRAERADVLVMAKKLGAKLLVTSNRLYVDYGAESRTFTDAGLEVLDALTITNLANTASKLQLDIQSIDLDRPAFTILTSGTTGAPKISIHTLRSLVQNIIDLAESAGLQGKLTALTPLLSHIFGLSVFLVTQVLGMKTVLTQLEPVAFVKAVHRHKPELIAALPQFYGALLSAPDNFIDLSNARLLLCGGSPLTVSLSTKFQETFGKRLNNGYGSTECKLVAFNKDGPVVSVGKPVGNVKVDIVNEQDEVLPEGKSGEVRISGPILMDGYLDNEKETRKVLHDGHYYTGDIGRFENGYLFVTGRKNDVIIVGGVVVEAGQVEEALRHNKDVRDVAVTGVKNKRLGQIIKASVVLTDEKLADKLKSVDPDERREARQQLQGRFRAFCKEHLSRYQCPMEWEFLGPHDNLPKTLAGKTDKKSM